MRVQLRCYHTPTYVPCNILEHAWMPFHHILVHRSKENLTLPTTYLTAASLRHAIFVTAARGSGIQHGIKTTYNNPASNHCDTNVRMHNIKQYVVVRCVREELLLHSSASFVRIIARKLK